MTDHVAEELSDEGRNEEKLHEALGRSQRLGFLGDRPVSEAITHARAFVEAVDGVTGRVIDLGAGGGLPGLVIATDRPDLLLTLLDRRTKRTDFLSQMVRRLGVADRVDVIADDAETALRAGLGGFDAAVARGFGPPEFTLRIATRFVRPGGWIVISEPPTGDRWTEDGLAELVTELQLTRLPSGDQVVRFQKGL